MNQVKVLKKTLLSKIQENRTKHAAEFEEAHALWVISSISYHKAQIEALEHSNSELSELARNKAPQPKSYVHDYDRVIAMLGMSVETEITLSAKEFEQYVMDTWVWTDSFKSLTSSLKGL